MQIYLNLYTIRYFNTSRLLKGYSVKTRREVSSAELMDGRRRN